MYADTTNESLVVQFRHLMWILVAAYVFMLGIISGTALVKEIKGQAQILTVISGDLQVLAKFINDYQNIVLDAPVPQQPSTVNTVIEKPISSLSTHPVVSEQPVIAEDSTESQPETVRKPPANHQRIISGFKSSRRRSIR